MVLLCELIMFFNFFTYYFFILWSDICYLPINKVIMIFSSLFCIPYKLAAGSTLCQTPVWPLLQVKRFESPFCPFRYLYWTSDCPVFGYWGPLQSAPESFMNSLILGVSRFSRLILCISGPRYGNSYFSKKPWAFFQGKWYLKTTDCLLGMIIVSWLLQWTCYFMISN